jgi:hypothetical protein
MRIGGKLFVFATDLGRDNIVAIGICFVSGVTFLS